VVLFLILLTICVIPWIGTNRHTDVHRTDLMAGDEGED
jgi:hypothetical protein